MAKAVDIKDGILFVRTRHYDDVKAVVVRHQEKPEKRFYKVNEGEWLELPKAFDSRELPCKCSICEHILSFINFYPKSNFCPNCGADMRKGGKNGSDKQNTIDN